MDTKAGRTETHRHEHDFDHYRKGSVESLFDWFRTMLDTQPVYRDENLGWQVFSYEHISRIIADHDQLLLRNGEGVQPPHPDLDFVDRGGNLVTKDPPRHWQLRLRGDDPLRAAP